ncbi:phage tail sheath C-terminal domain-containing protein [Myxococcus sp. RHSTA-1-4]|uniref:phage tail sheath family protein n=1 Tax=Myxococcus sp. RHSTA-1-4 TaxID=2874601 RepID=UPI001CBC3B59|nr:phage tail sheath C-terminal domain-containing protein [Myxococcus sp. RHSTA-1-4]MBZ4420164.1 phage tail sheath subtilisin-like domain-containing protein [Myxococcus sp. RHSTA-1-4]
MVALTYPGVYTVEVPSGVRTIVGVSTSTALFIGSSPDGPLNQPVQCFNYTDFARVFSDDITSEHQLGRYVRLFFLNGGSLCWVVRVASGAQASSIQLKPEVAGAVALKLEARNAGQRGDMLRARVDYNTSLPESTFNLEVFRQTTDSSGAQVKQDAELWKNLSMDSSSPLYVVDVLKQGSKLVTAELVGSPTPNNGISLSGRPVTFSGATTLPGAWNGVIGKNAPARKFQISVGGRSYVTVDLSDLDVVAQASAAALAAELHKRIVEAHTRAGILLGDAELQVAFFEAPSSEAGTTASLLQLTGIQQEVLVRAALEEDAAVTLGLGTAQGGLEISPFAAYRPAPSGNTLSPGVNPASPAEHFKAAYGLEHSDLAKLTIGSVEVPLPLPVAGAEPLFQDSGGGNNGLRERLQGAVDAFNTLVAAPPPGTSIPWRAELWGYRLALLPTGSSTNEVVNLSTSNAALDGGLTQNVGLYQLGAGGAGSFQDGGTSGNDGSAPTQKEYDEAFIAVDREVDIFNLMCLPPDTASTDMSSFWGPASVFCLKRRALLLVDAPVGWTDAQSAQKGVANARVGVVKDHAALFFPRLLVDEKGRKVPVNPAGAIAGLMARIDGTRGVWKAPAGTEADLRGVVGLERRFSDPENGALNPQAINTLRVFPTGIVNWGARTMDGSDDSQSEYKYIPIRRVALFIEESLYRGLKWVVFEPNDEPLWAQIRLNVGSFMNGLFRQGAFQGARPADAYFVRCDAETTTQDDRNRGIVNIWVGFAPLKPAEFVVLYLQQMAGQIQV